MLVRALFSKGFAHLVGFLTRACRHFRFRHRRRERQLQCGQQLLLARTGFGHLAGHYLATLRMEQFHDAKLFEFPQAFFHRDLQRPPGAFQMATHFYRKFH